MAAILDLDDVAATSEFARKQLDQLREAHEQVQSRITELEAEVLSLRADVERETAEWNVEVERNKALEALNETRLREIQTTLKLLAEARREAAEAQSREKTCRATVREACENYEEVIFGDCLCACLPLEYISALNDEADLPDDDQSALTAAIEAAVLAEREACAAMCALNGEHDLANSIRARSAK